MEHPRAAAAAPGAEALSQTPRARAYTSPARPPPRHRRRLQPLTCRCSVGLPSPAPSVLHGKTTALQRLTMPTVATAMVMVLRTMTTLLSPQYLRSHQSAPLPRPPPRSPLDGTRRPQSNRRRRSRQAMSSTSEPLRPRAVSAAVGSALGLGRSHSRQGPQRYLRDSSGERRQTGFRAQPQ